MRSCPSKLKAESLPVKETTIQHLATQLSSYVLSRLNLPSASTVDDATSKFITTTKGLELMILECLFTELFFISLLSSAANDKTPVLKVSEISLPRFMFYSTFTDSYRKAIRG